MPKSNLYNIESRVKTLLFENPLLREDDYMLFAEYVKKYNPELAALPLSEVLTNHFDCGLPSYEGITRTRRKIQAKYPELRSVNAAHGRAESQKEYFEYSQN